MNKKLIVGAGLAFSLLFNFSQAFAAEPTVGEEKGG